MVEFCGKILYYACKTIKFLKKSKSLEHFSIKIYSEEDYLQKSLCLLVEFCEKILYYVYVRNPQELLETPKNSRKF
jgi:hypothetical protein